MSSNNSMIFLSGFIGRNNPVITKAVPEAVMDVVIMDM